MRSWPCWPLTWSPHTMSEKYMSIGAPMTELPLAQPRGHTSHSHRWQSVNIKQSVSQHFCLALSINIYTDKSLSFLSLFFRIMSHNEKLKCDYLFQSHISYGRWSKISRQLLQPRFRRKYGESLCVFKGPIHCWPDVAKQECGIWVLKEIILRPFQAEHNSASARILKS